MSLSFLLLSKAAKVKRNENSAAKITKMKVCAK